MPPRQINSFYLAVICEPAELYCVKGPMRDDTAETNLIGGMADVYHIRCFTLGQGTRELGRKAVLGIYPKFQEATYQEVIEAALQTAR